MRGIVCNAIREGENERNIPGEENIAVNLGGDNSAGSSVLRACGITWHETLARYDGGHDSGTSFGHEEMPFVRKRKGWAGFAAVLVMGGALAYGYTRYTAYQKEQEQARIEQERQEQLRVQAEQERSRKE